MDVVRKSNVNLSSTLEVEIFFWKNPKLWIFGGTTSNFWGSPLLQGFIIWTPSAICKIILPFIQLQSWHVTKRHKCLTDSGATQKVRQQPKVCSVDECLQSFILIYLWLKQGLKREVLFFHIKPYNKNFSNHNNVLHHFYDKRCSAESRITSWLVSTMDSKGHFQNPSKNTNARFQRRQTHWVISSVRWRSATKIFA